jgi:hypothetical protein
MTRIVGTLENDLGRLYNKNVDIPLVERGREPPKGGFAFEGRLERIMRRYCLAILVPLLLTAGGCNNPSLNKTLENQANEIKTLRSDVDDLKSQIELNKMVQDWDQIAYLTPGSRGYSPVRTDLGAITISLDDVQPYGNGTKIKLRFGNTTDALVTKSISTL